MNPNHDPGICPSPFGGGSQCFCYSAEKIRGNAYSETIKLITVNYAYTPCPVNLPYSEIKRIRIPKCGQSIDHPENIPHPSLSLSANPTPSIILGKNPTLITTQAFMENSSGRISNLICTPDNNISILNNNLSNGSWVNVGTFTPVP